jgi:hypothetical protein
MIILEENTLRFSFPNVHQAAEMRLDLQRTLRIPDDSTEYPLPPGLGTFPLRHMEDFSERLGPDLAKRGGVILPMHPSEALWINFGGGHPSADGTTNSMDEDSLPYPFALKIAAG